MHSDTIYPVLSHGNRRGHFAHNTIKLHYILNLQTKFIEERNEIESEHTFTNQIHESNLLKDAHIIHPHALTNLQVKFIQGHVHFYKPN